MKFRRFSMKRLTGALLASLVIFQTAAIHAAEASIWDERRRAVKASRAVPDAAGAVDDTRDQKPGDGETLLASLPAVRPGLAAFQSPDIQNPLLAGLETRHAVPTWIQTAVTPFATIQSARLSGAANAPTVVLMQDAHLHAEAQRNIAGSIEALARDLAARNGRFLVAMEGAADGPIDYSGYAAADPALRREVARALAERKILSGAEAAAVATAGIRDGRNLFDTVGIENFAMYEDNVRALRETAPLRPAAELALSDLRRELIELKRRHFDADLIRFDGRKAAFEDGKLGLPSFTLYLDSVVPVQSRNLRELVEAALLEGALKFDRVEAERRKLLARLVEKMTDAEVKGLLQASLRFRAGALTYADYYDVVRSLASRHGISLADYPEVNVYIQYVLKAEGIDHRALFSELASHELIVQKKLASTDAQRELLLLDSDLHLLRKLVDRSLIESEWHALESRRGELARLLDRLAGLGGGRPASAVEMAPRWQRFEAFYVSALTRNGAMVENLARAVGRSQASVALMVAGGFHTDGLAALLGSRGFNVFVLSPRISGVGDGPSSLEFLAEGRLPLNEIFTGERLFLPTPPVTALTAVPAGSQTGRSAATLVRSLVLGFVAALRRLASAPSETVVTLVQDGMRFSAGRGRAAGPGRLALNVAVDGETRVVSVEPEFTSAFAGVPFNRIIQAARVRSGPGGFQFSNFVLDLLAAGRLGNRPVIRGGPREVTAVVVSQLRSLAGRNRNSPAARMADAIARSNGILNPFVEFVLDEFVRSLRTGAGWTHVDNFISQNQNLATVEDVPADVRGALDRVRSQIGSSANVTVALVSGDRTGSYSQVERIGEGPAARYIVHVSVEFLRSKIDSRIDDVVRLAGFTGPDARVRARGWLLDQWAVHELAEALLRRVPDGTLAGARNREAIHDLLQNNGFGTVLPRNRADYQRPVAALLKDLVARNAAVFPDGASGRINPAVSAPAAATPAATTAAPAARAQITPQAVTRNPYDPARRRNINLGAYAGVVALTRDGKRAAAQAGREVRILDADTGAVIARVAVESAQALLFSPDGRYLAVGDVSGRVSIVNLSNVASPVVRTSAGHADTVSAMAFTADGSRLLTGADNGTLQEWNVSTAERTRSFASGSPTRIAAVGYAADGRVLVSTDYDLREFSAAGVSQPVRRYPDEVRRWSGAGVRVAISADGAKLAVFYGSELQILRASDLVMLQRFGPMNEAAASLQFSADGRQLAGVFSNRRSDGVNRVAAFDVAPGLEPILGATRVVDRVAPSQIVSTPASYPLSVSVNGNGTRIISAQSNDGVQINERTAPTGGAGTAFSGRVRAVAAIVFTALSLIAFTQGAGLVDPITTGLAGIVGGMLGYAAVQAEEATHARVARMYGDSPIRYWYKVEGVSDRPLIYLSGQLAFLAVTIVPALVMASLVSPWTIVVYAALVLGTPDTRIWARAALPSVRLRGLVSIPRINLSGLVDPSRLSRRTLMVFFGTLLGAAVALGVAIGSGAAPAAVMSTFTIFGVGFVVTTISGIGDIRAPALLASRPAVVEAPPVVVAPAPVTTDDTSTARAPVAAPARAAVPSARPSAAPAIQPAPAVAPGRSSTVSLKTSRYYRMIRGNRAKIGQGEAATPIPVGGVRDVVSFFLALAIYRADSKVYFRNADSALVFQDGLPADKVRDMRAVGRLLRSVITDDALTVDALFDQFERNPDYRRLTPQIRGYAVAAFLLKSRNRRDDRDVTSPIAYRLGTASNPAAVALARPGISRSAAMRIAEARNRQIDRIRLMRFSFSDNTPIETAGRTPAQIEAQRRAASQVLNIDQIAASTRTMIKLNAAIRDEIVPELRRAVRDLRRPENNGQSADPFIDGVAIRIAGILERNVPPVEPGGSLAGFDEIVKTLFDVLDDYAGRVAARAARPELKGAILARMLRANADESSPSIGSWSISNVQLRSQFDRLDETIRFAGEIEDANREAIRIAGEESARLAAEQTDVVAPESPEEAPVTLETPADAADPIEAELTRELSSRFPGFALNFRIPDFGRLVQWGTVLATLIIPADAVAARQKLALMIVRLERLEKMIRRGQAFGSDAEADRLGRAVVDLRRLYLSGAAVTPQRISEIISEAARDPLTRSVLLPMISLPADLSGAAEAAADATPVAAFYNNGIARVVAESILDGATADQATYRVSALANALYALISDNRESPSPLTLTLVAYMTRLNTLGSVGFHSDDPVAVLANAIMPIFGLSIDITRVILEQAGLAPDRTSKEFEKVDQELRSVLSFFNTSADVEIELLEGDQRSENRNIAFVQTFETGAGPRVIIRLTRAELRRIRGVQTGDSVDISGTLAEAHQARLAALGVRLTDNEASDLALRIFLLHELGEEVLDIKDGRLEQMGLADRARLLALDAESNGALPGTAYVSSEGIVGQMEGQVDHVGPEPRGQVKPAAVAGNASPTSERRRREIAAISTLTRALPVLAALFPNRQVLNYTLGLSNGGEIRFNADGSLDTANLNILEQSPVAQSRLAAMRAEVDAGRTFTEMTSAQVDDRFRIGEPTTLAIYDQTGGFKDLADRFSAFLNQKTGRHVIGVPQDGAAFLAAIDAYVGLLRRKVEGGAGELESDLLKAQTLRNHVAASLGEAVSVNGVELNPANARIGVVTLDADEQALITQNADGLWDVSKVVPLFQTKAASLYNVDVQRLVFFSDWRQLVAAQVSLAVETAMNANAFLSLEGRIEAVNLIAIQA